MKFRRKRNAPIPEVSASLLDGVEAIRVLQDLPDEELKVELINATTTEGWLRTTGATFRSTDFDGKDSLAELAEHGAAYARTAREVIALILFSRANDEKKEDQKNGGGYL